MAKTKKEEQNGWSRRDILKAAGAVGGSLLAQNALASGPTAGMPLEGMIEMHVHPGPDITPRSVNDFDLVIKAREEGMRGIVLKNHEFITNDRAYLVKQMVPGIEVFGGLVLNEPVGGVNPVAVETMLRFSGECAKYVWLPTHDAAFQKSVDKKPGGGSGHGRRRTGPPGGKEGHAVGGQGGCDPRHGARLA